MGILHCWRGLLGLEIQHFEGIGFECQCLSLIKFFVLFSFLLFVRLLKYFVNVQVWRFLITFADVLGIWPFTLDEFVQAFHDYVRIFLSLLKFI